MHVTWTIRNILQKRRRKKTPKVSKNKKINNFGIFQYHSYEYPIIFVSFELARRRHKKHICLQLKVRLPVSGSFLLHIAYCYNRFAISFQANLICNDCESLYSFQIEFIAKLISHGPCQMADEIKSCNNQNNRRNHDKNIFKLDTNLWL